MEVGDFVSAELGASVVVLASVQAPTVTTKKPVKNEETIFLFILLICESVITVLYGALRKSKS